LPGLGVVLGAAVHHQPPFGGYKCSVQDRDLEMQHSDV